MLKNSAKFLPNPEPNRNFGCFLIRTTLLTKLTAAKNEVTLRYHRVHWLYFLAAIFAATIYIIQYTYHKRWVHNLHSFPLNHRILSSRSDSRMSSLKPNGSCVIHVTHMSHMSSLKPNGSCVIHVTHMSSLKPNGSCVIHVTHDSWPQKNEASANKFC